MSRHGKRAADKTLLSVNIPKELKAELESLAVADNRTLSNFVVTELIKHTQRAKRKPPKAQRARGNGPNDSLSLSA